MPILSQCHVDFWKFVHFREFRSSISQQLIVPKTKLNLGKHAFSVTAHRVWNEFLIILKSSETIVTFSKKLVLDISNCISIINMQ